MRRSVRGNMDDFEEYDKPQDTATEKSLVKLHKKVIRCLQIANRTQIQWNNLTQKALDLEDIEANDNNPNKHFHRSYGSYSGMFRAIYTPTVGESEFLVTFFFYKTMGFFGGFYELLKAYLRNCFKIIDF